ncbi:MAG: adenosine deaminase [Clostridiales bacterium]|nr:adenosine deaminase [Clostridiales bacterium]
MMAVFSIPKIELHLHLDGAIPPETMWTLAKQKRVPLPADTLEDFKTYLVRSADCRDVNEYLKRFELPLQLLQDRASLVRVTRELIGVLAGQGHIYDEIRFAPQLHCREGLSQRDAIEAVLQGRAQALNDHPEIKNGILLCAMVVGPETVNMQQNLETVRLCREYLGMGVVGLDLAGAEGIVPLRNFRPIFDLARELDVPYTCHAGDSQGPDTVKDALGFGVRRIGHGHHVYDAPELWPQLMENGVTLEICPSSNIQCRTQPSYAEHPAKKLFDAGVRVTISTDNMTLAATDLDGEYTHCVEEMGFSEKDLVQMNIYAAEAAFLPKEERQALAEALRKYL